MKFKFEFENLLLADAFDVLVDEVSDQAKHRAAGKPRTGPQSPRRRRLAGSPAARRPGGPGAPIRARSLRTRAVLIEAAGRSFARLGFEGGNGQDICREAGVHSAAIVYHFGGLAGLYRAVLDEARARLPTTQQIQAAVDAQSDPRRRLEAFLGLLVRTLLSPLSQSWAGRLFAREFVSPSRIYGPIHDDALLARAKILKDIIAALTGRAPADPLVARGCISTIAPCAVLLLVDRRKLELLLPNLDMGKDAAPALTRHLVDFALAGLRAISAYSSRAGEPRRGRRDSPGPATKASTATGRRPPSAT